MTDPSTEIGEVRGFTARVVAAFLTGNLAPLFVILSLALGAFALMQTPREEEPQIVVPLADVIVEVPGASAAEVESLVTTHLERLLWQIEGVEYVYSASEAHRAVITVRFFVGEDREDALLALHTKLEMHRDSVPPQIARWTVKPIEVDDVPIVSIALWSKTVSDHELRRIAEELEHVVQGVALAGPTQIVGGRPRRILIDIDPDALNARGIAVDDVAHALAGAAASSAAGRIDSIGRQVQVELRGRAPSIRELSDLVVGVRDDRPVALRDVASLRDSAAERTSYTRIRFGKASAEFGDDSITDYPAVMVAVAKRRGSNAVDVSAAVRAKIESVAPEILPDDVHWRVVRDHGESADHKVDELLEGLLVAIVIVVALIALSLGFREGLIVATAVPITFGLTLFVNHLLGYSINRVTLFALTLALGLVVDDPIVDVENIHRHLRMGRRKPLDAVLHAVNEVRPPIILATLAVIVSFLPLFGITGMMGPYMSPMALNVPVAMLMSLLVAFMVTPWLSHLVLRNHVKPAPSASAVDDGDSLRGSLVWRVYRSVMDPLLDSRSLRIAVIGVTAVLFAGSCWLALDRSVPLKMLPFDNKNELQIIVDLPEGSSLESTQAALEEMAEVVSGAGEVTDVTTYAGTSSPIDFNGMVRHYALRQAPHQGDLRINLVGKRERAADSHSLSLSIRSWLLPIAERHGAKIAMVEQPPGPPVIQTLTVEIHGEANATHDQLREAASRVEARLRQEAGVVDVDSTVESPWRMLRFELDRTKAALHGITDAGVAELLSAAIGGRIATAFHAARERTPLLASIRLPRPQRADRAVLERLTVRSARGEQVPIGEIGSFIDEFVDPAIWRKNLEPLQYVFAEVAGRAPAEVIYDVDADRLPNGSVVHSAAPDGETRPVSERTYLSAGAGIPWAMPHGTDAVWKGEGEWKITIDAFRDLGIAFLAACFGIYVLLVHETKSYFMPLILMLSIPFTILGILPGFWLLNVIGAGEVAGARTPIFFTATAMIGMIALAGIAVRNAILLIEFLQSALRRGESMRDAIVMAGAIRLRPIFLTAGTALLAAIPITLDPIFSGLAWSLIFGLLVSSLFTLVLVPMAYAMVYGRGSNAETAADARVENGIAPP